MYGKGEGDHFGGCFLIIFFSTLFSGFSTIIINTEYGNLIYIINFALCFAVLFYNMSYIYYSNLEFVLTISNLFFLASCDVIVFYKNPRRSTYSHFIKLKMATLLPAVLVYCQPSIRILKS